MGVSAPGPSPNNLICQKFLIVVGILKNLSHPSPNAGTAPPTQRFLGESSWTLMTTDSQHNQPQVCLRKSHTALLGDHSSGSLCPPHIVEEIMHDPGQIPAHLRPLVVSHERVYERLLFQSQCCGATIYPHRTSHLLQSMSRTSPFLLYTAVETGAMVTACQLRVPNRTKPDRKSVR